MIGIQGFEGIGIINISLLPSLLKMLDFLWGRCSFQLGST